MCYMCTYAALVHLEWPLSAAVEVRDKKKMGAAICVPCHCYVPASRSLIAIEKRKC